MTEAELDRHVLQMIRSLGLFGYHAPDSRRATGAGMTDWVIIGRRVLWREDKTDDGRLSSAQTRVRYALVAAGQDWAIWRPRDYRSGRIWAELSAISRHDTKGRS